ncbi:hypothetical protein EA462_16235 [Natrarchaeobius halalkaliphilus]|uniref:Uncharacterized protein n=1 Tax=Natrarchaeobius halalkaliphilus TaxID=1679091 RepID=A0A3N6LHZ5_9EURY|nr:hypothetical protein [Natrarchaeobius halalkaliphilus]RQG86689.1 hypothetical protein EA462_16235 [Natrarchaeobius halalkaliphilus]
MSARTSFWSVINTYRPILSTFFAILLVLFVLNTFAFVSIDRTAETFVIVLLNFGILGGLLVATGLTLWRCRQHRL